MTLIQSITKSSNKKDLKFIRECINNNYQNGGITSAEKGECLRVLNNRLKDIKTQCNVNVGKRKKGSKRSVAIIIAFFGALFGVHKFYLGDYRKGILYFLFFWTFIPTILSGIDIIKFLKMSEPEWDKYVSSIREGEKGLKKPNKLTATFLSLTKKRKK